MRRVRRSEKEVRWSVVASCSDCGPTSRSCPRRGGAGRGVNCERSPNMPIARRPAPPPQEPTGASSLPPAPTATLKAVNPGAALPAASCSSSAAPLVCSLANNRQGDC